MKSAKTNSQLGNDPEMCEKLIPKYELGCKRILFSLMEFLPLFVDRRRKMRPTLVADEVAEVTEDGISTKKGEHIPADLIGRHQIEIFIRILCDIVGYQFTARASTSRRAYAVSA